MHDKISQSFSTPKDLLFRAKPLIGNRIPRIRCNRSHKLSISAVLSVPSQGTTSRNNVTDLDAKRSFRSRNAERSQSKSAAEEDRQCLCLVNEDGIRLTLTQKGRLTVWDDEAGSLVAQANLHLPPYCSNIAPIIINDHQNGSAIVRWSTPSLSPLAELHITPTHSSTPPSTSSSWSKNLSRGFVLDFLVNSTAMPSSSGAEIAIHLEPSGYWFGGGHFIRQVWPLNNAALEVGPWYAFDNGPNGVNTLLGPHWMTSGGLLVAVDPDTPYLHVGMNAPLHSKRGWTPRKWGVGIQNAARELLPLTQEHARVSRNGTDGLLRIQARSSYQDHKMIHPLKEWGRHHHHQQQVTHSSETVSDDDLARDSHVVHSTASSMLSVRVALCATENAAEACKMALNTLSPPKQMPSPEVLRAPIWTTWARYKTAVNQTKVLQYAHQIADRDLQRSVMEIDDRWQVAYGDLSFDPRKFPDPVGMVKELHDLGFKVTTWVHPFVEEKSDAYQEGATKGYFVGCKAGTTVKGWFGRWRSGGAPPIVPVAPGGSAPGFFAWWNSPPVAALDVTNPEAVDWFVGRLRALQASTGIDGFKFDAGEPCFLPRQPVTHIPLATPADYTRLYVRNVAGQFAGGVSEVRTGHMTQDVAVFCRMGDRFSTWDAANGLRSLIPTLLTSGVLGYPFTLPDMIGGNRYFAQGPDSELLVRWAQVNALMPAMQFSIAPWDFSKETEALVASALQVRGRMEGLLLSLAEEAANTLMPICRPLWMLAPGDEQTFLIQDQFALGEHAIVAPVVHRGARHRDVYLTQGTWCDMNDGTLIEGGRWLRNMSTPLDRLPVFVREGAPGVHW